MADIMDWRRPLLLALAAFPYLTPAKVANMARCSLEERRRVALPRSRPYVLFLDVTNSCNLRCPYCPTGARRESGRSRNLMDLAIVRRLMDEMGSYLISVNLFNWGEPMLHPQLAAIIDLCHGRGVFTQLSTNLSIGRGERLVELCGSELDYMMVSISGASQQVYSRYHRGGEVDLVFENLRRIVELKRAGKHRKPYVEVKYLCFKHNMHEVDLVRSRARKIGVDLFRHVIAGGAEEDILDQGEAPPRKLHTRYCRQLWSTLVLEPDAGLAPCCCVFQGRRLREIFTKVHPGNQAQRAL